MYRLLIALARQQRVFEMPTCPIRIFASAATVDLTEAYRDGNFVSAQAMRNA